MLIWAFWIGIIVFACVGLFLTDPSVKEQEK